MKQGAEKRKQGAEKRKLGAEKRKKRGVEQRKCTSPFFWACPWMVPAGSSPRQRGGTAAAYLEGIHLRGWGILRLPCSLPTALLETHGAGSVRSRLSHAIEFSSGRCKSSPLNLERGAPGASRHRHSSHSPVRICPQAGGGAGEAASPTRSSPPTSMMGVVGSPAHSSSITRSGTPTSTHNGSETQSGSLSGLAGSALDPPSSGAPGRHQLIYHLHPFLAQYASDGQGVREPNVPGGPTLDVLLGTGLPSFLVGGGR